MNREDIARMAREAGINVTEGNSFADDIHISILYRFANIVAAVEREGCAKLMGELTCMGDAKECFEVAATYIRARGA